MQSVSKLTNLQGKKVILRLDLNVPLNNGEITDTTRIDKVLPTIEFLLKQNSKIVILSHVGRPKGKVIKDLSLKPIQKDIEKKLNEKIKLIEKNIYEEGTLSNLNSSFDIIFLDPPYKDRNISELIDKIFEINLLSKNGIIITHRNKNVKEKYSKNFRILEEKTYGISKISFGNLN